MRGFAFALLERALVDQCGPDSWDDLLDAVGWQGPTGLSANYDDQLFDRLLAQACSDRDDTARWRWFAAHASTHLRAAQVHRLPNQHSFHTQVEQRYLRLEMLCTGRTAPTLTWRLDTANPDVVALSRGSAGLPCGVLEGLLLAAPATEPDHHPRAYQPKCTAQGAPGCLVVLDRRSPGMVGR